jgi:hypothetical protein
MQTKYAFEYATNTVGHRTCLRRRQAAGFKERTALARNKHQEEHCKKKTVHDQVKRKKPIKTTAEPKGRRRSKKKSKKCYKHNKMKTCV